MSSEYLYVEEPLLNQLETLGWRVIRAAEADKKFFIPTDPRTTLRENFSEIVVRSEFFAGVRSINRTDDGREWLTDRQLQGLYDEVTGIFRQSGSLVVANQQIQSLLTGETPLTVDRNELTGEISPRVLLLDFTDITNFSGGNYENRFLAMNQFKVEAIGLGKSFSIFDLVLFGNGFPLVIEEGKYFSNYNVEKDLDPIAEGIRQMFRYMNRRDETEGVTEDEGSPEAFAYSLLNVISSGDRAVYGSLTTPAEGYSEWKYIPKQLQDGLVGPGGKNPRQQETLVQGLLSPAVVLDLLRNYSVFETDAKTGKTKKNIAYYQQYRTINALVEHMRNPNILREDRDKVVWHTQGTGKSMQMCFIHRKFNSTPDLQDVKLITTEDRLDLQDQIYPTLQLSGVNLRKIETKADLKTYGSRTTSDALVVMMHKFATGKYKDDKFFEKWGIPAPPQYVEFSEINPSDRILVMSDEVHRTQAGDFGTNLRTAFPNATFLGFTGTPKMIDEKGHNTTDIYKGGYLDVYRLQNAREDNVILPVYYETAIADMTIDSPAELDQDFEDLFDFGTKTKEEKERILSKYGNPNDIFLSEKRMKKIARYVVRHYLEKVFVNGFKGQLVLSSRDATIRMQEYVRSELKRQTENLVRKIQNSPDGDADKIRVLNQLDAVVVISGDGNNERPEITRVRREADSRQAVPNFRKNFNPADADSCICLLIVCDMLLTGFDAPINQVMYLDKRLIAHNLLQAIARVNRKAHGKEAGYIVDFIGVTLHLQEALAMYGDDELENTIGSLINISEAVSNLTNSFAKLLDFWKTKGITDIEELVFQRMPEDRSAKTIERILELMADETDRFKFYQLFKEFAKYYDIVVPNPTAKKYGYGINFFGYIRVETKRLYEQPQNGDGKELLFRGKVQELIDEHIIANNLEVGEPIELMSMTLQKELEDPDNSTTVLVGATKTAIQNHIDRKFLLDPAFYGSISRKVETILGNLNADADSQLRDLKKLVGEIKETETCRSQLREALFYDTVIETISEDGKSLPSDDERSRLKHAMIDIVEKVTQRMKLIGFWSDAEKQKKLRSEIYEQLMFLNIPQVNHYLEKLSYDIVDLAKRRRDYL